MKIRVQKGKGFRGGHENTSSGRKRLEGMTRMCKDEGFKGVNAQKKKYE
jgi:hypothetical protein